MMHTRYRIIIAMVMITLFISATISAFVIFYADDIIVNNSITSISSAVFNTASELDMALTHTENIALTLRQFFQDTLDIDKYNKDSHYRDRWLHQLDQMMRVLSLDTSEISSLYVYLVPESLNDLTSFAYGDRNRDGFPEPLTLVHPATLKSSDAPYYYETWMSKAGTWYAGSYRENVQEPQLQELSYNVRIQINGSTFAIVSVGFPFSEFRSVLEKMPLQSGIYPVLIDEKYKIMIHPSLEYGTELTQIFESRFQEKIDKASKEPYGFKEYDWDKNIKKIIVFKKLKSQWTIAAALEKTTLYAPYYNLLKGLVGLFAVSTAIAVILSFEVAQSIYKPIIALANYVKHFKTPDLRAPLKLEGPFISKEIYTLEAALVELENHLNTSLEKLVLYNHQLEKEVQLKSVELVHMNDMLSHTVDTLENQSIELKNLNTLLESNRNALQKAQNQLADSEKLASIGFLISGISHELNTPIGNTITLATYLDSEIKRLLVQLPSMAHKPAFQKDSQLIFDQPLNLIENNLRQGKMIIHRIKTLTASDENIEFEDIQLNSFLNELSEKLFNQYPDKELTLRIISDLDLLITTNRFKLTQVFENLFLNSILHGFEGRTAGQIIIRYHLTKTEWVIHYFDDGKGIDSDNIPHIFTPFFSTKFGVNKGLGLNLVYNLVTLFFNGQISCDATATLGAHFELHLRIKEIRPLKEVTPL